MSDAPTCCCDTSIPSTRVEFGTVTGQLIAGWMARPTPRSLCNVDPNDFIVAPTEEIARRRGLFRYGPGSFTLEEVVVVPRCTMASIHLSLI